MRKALKKWQEALKEWKEIIWKLDDSLSEKTWDVIHWSFENISQILKIVPKWKIYDFIEKHKNEINKIIKNDKTPKIIKNFYDSNKQIYSYLNKTKEDYLSYLNNLDEREANIERFKLLLFSILIIPWWTTILIAILWKWAILANLAFLFPNKKLPIPAARTKNEIINFFKENNFKEISEKFQNFLKEKLKFINNNKVK